MGIDYMIHYACEPKRALTVEGLMGRLKGRDRAEAIIRLYRDEGDDRHPSGMGFEMVRRAADGDEEIEMVVVQDLLDASDELAPWEHFCEGCPANAHGKPFGCVGTINYPLSRQGERWLLDQLPDNEYPLTFMLLQAAIREHGYRGEVARRLRAQEGVFFESAPALDRDLEAIRVDGDQVFELLFLSGPITPAFGGLLLQFFGGISQGLGADVMLQLSNPPSAEWLAEHAPFAPQHEHADDVTITSLKEFLWALYVAFGLQVPLLLDV